MKRLLWVTELTLLASCSHTAPSAKPAAAPNAVEVSNQYAAKLLAVEGAFVPEDVSQYGVTGFDEAVVDLAPDVARRAAAAFDEVAHSFAASRARETDPFVRDDLQMLEEAARLLAKSTRIEDEELVPIMNVHGRVFRGLRALLDARVPVERRPAAKARMIRYAGLEPGRPSVARLAQDRAEEKMEKGLYYPSRAEVEQVLENAPTLRHGIADLLERFPVEGTQAAAKQLDHELLAYKAFLKDKVLPRASKDFRLPERVYRLRLEQVGVTDDPLELAQRAHTAYAATMKEAVALAAVVGAQRGLKDVRFASVMTALKQEQLTGEALSAHYEQRISQLEEIIRKESLVTLPARAMHFRVATAPETAVNPAPTIDIQGFLQGKDEIPMVLPVSGSVKEGALRYDDFTYPAASWAILAHEGRPGHELQFTAMSTRGLSLARMLFAFNSANIEGWGLYAEGLIRPFMPPEGRLVSLQLLLGRQARAFLDPELQLGKISEAEARRRLLDEVRFSPAMVDQEIHRYTFTDPAQATSYFFGYERMLALRADLEHTLGPRFSPKTFHDTVLAQGLLPPAALSAAVKQALGSGAR